MDVGGRLQAVLDGPLAWHELVDLDEVASTNDVAADRVRAGAPAGVVVVAQRQTAGRGRLERRWEDRPGGSLLVSLTVPAPDSDATLVPLAAGIALSDAAHRQGVATRLKWPNDLLAPTADGGTLAKCGGILTERVEGPSGAQLVIGIGVDVDWRGIDRAGEAAEWTSLAESANADIDRTDLLVDLLRGVDAWVRDLLRGSHRITHNYLAKCATIDADVVVFTPDGGRITGRATGIAPDGALIVDDLANGTRVVITAGDVVHATLH